MNQYEKFLRWGMAVIQEPDGGDIIPKQKRKSLGDEPRLFSLHRTQSEGFGFLGWDKTRLLVTENNLSVHHLVFKQFLPRSV